MSRVRSSSFGALEQRLSEKEHESTKSKLAASLRRKTTIRDKDGKVMPPLKHPQLSNDPAFGDPEELIRVESEVQQYYDTSLNSVQWRVSNLNVHPGEPLFVFWFVLSSYFPLICGCIGPLSNSFSLFAIVCSWKVPQDVEIGSPDFQGADEYWVYLINGISVFLALISNFFLLLNFRKKVRYRISQVISVSGWFLASGSLMCLVIGYHAYFYQAHLDDTYVLSYGFYFAIVTVCLHWCNFMLLFMNELGFLLKKYKPVFNINNVQKSLIFQASSLALWLIIGAAMCVKLLGTSLGFGLYYCIISIVTIGEEQDVPNNAKAQGWMSFWVLIGLVFFGLIVSSVVDSIFEFSTSTLYWNRLAATKKYRLKLKKGEIVSDEGGFAFMRDVDSIATLSQKYYSFLWTSLAFFLVFFLGAMGFSLIEGWGFRLGCYFCFCCIITLGCGDIVPITPGGHVLFCIWALASIPTMTTMVSNLSELVFSRLKKLNDIDMYDFLYKISKGRKHLHLIQEVFSARKDSIDVSELENVMQDTNVSTDSRFFERLRHNSESNPDIISSSSDDSDQDELARAISHLELTSEQCSVETNPSLEQDSNGSSTSATFSGIEKRLSEVPLPTVRIESPANKLQRNVTQKDGAVLKPVRTNEIYKSIALATHPVDTLFEFIFNNNKLSNLDFVYSTQFIDGTTMTTHLENYCREGSSVTNLNNRTLSDARSKLIRAFKIIDHQFDERRFVEAYQLDDDVVNTLTRSTTILPGATYVNHKKSVICPQDNRIHTLFLKKNDFILKNLSVLQILLTELKESLIMMCFRPSFKYSFTEWDRFLRLTENSSYLKYCKDGEFWLGPHSPLGFPIREPEYFSMTYIRHIESKLHRFAWEYDKPDYHLYVEKKEEKHE